MRALTLLLAFSALTVAAVPIAAAAQCIPCEPVNNVCKKVLKYDCLASSEPSPAVAAADSAPAVDGVRCSGGICDTINHLCGGCIPASDAGRCMGEVCDAINRVCETAFDVSCVG